tara:strand:- start:2544 stop:2741 length:198 start_codon:yes stop_codon:yes gene_type:complete
MEYVVSLVNEYGNQKTIILEAMDCKDAELVASKKYPTYEITRITQQALEVTYFNTVKSMKKGENG